MNLGVPRVIAKAISSDQGEVLEKIGAEVVYPERDMALRLARRLLTGSVLDNISLNNNVEIAEVRLTEKSAGRSVLEMDLRRSFGLNIIALEHNGKTDTEVDPAYIFKGDEILVVIGKKENITRFEKEKIDWRNRMQGSQENMITTVIKGICVGGTMLVPGCSGGSMAMILGIYDRLVSSVSSFMKHKKGKSLLSCPLLRRRRDGDGPFRKTSPEPDGTV